LLCKTSNAEANNSFEIVQHETLHQFIPYTGTVEDALAIQNGVAQGLSSAIMTNNLREAELFLSVVGLIAELQT
jgi:aldehyde dehydrogenase (NAD+)